jgi:biopolymer transport protein ExbD
MHIHRRKKRGFEETSALSDLAFLLIIYFIVIAGFNVNKGFLMNLPAKNSTRLVLRDSLLRMELDGGNNILYDNTVINKATAEEYIAGALYQKPDISLVLTVSPEASWENVVLFVELAQKLNVESFSFKLKKDDTQ